MPSLFQSLLNQDHGHLRIVAQLWGIEFSARERNAAREELCQKLANATLLNEMIESLPKNAQNALQDLVRNEGRLPWAHFQRQHGEIREYGIGRRDREKPHLKPISPAETLYYHALLARAFFNTEKGAIEFAYIPEDLLKIIQIQGQKAEKEKIFGRLARPEECVHPLPANDFLLDDLTTLLAALRTERAEASQPFHTSHRFAREIALAARLITPDGLEPLALKKHLEEDRATAFAHLREIWQNSENFNELRQIPALICEGEWKNPALETRQTIIRFLAALPRGEWWSLHTFIADIKKHQPDIQRTAGDYDAWLIRTAEEGQEEKSLGFSLRGFEHWDEVEGALIRYFVEKALFWLGYVDLAKGESGEVMAFRVSDEKTANLREGAGGKVVVTSSGQITVSRYTERAIRYQIARFTDWLPSKNPDKFKYQITTLSLARAKAQGLKTSQLAALLGKYSGGKLPPSLGKALLRWEASGTEARVQQMTVLRLSKPDDLRALRESWAGRFLGVALSPTTVEIREGTSQKIMAALIEMGILLEDGTSEA